MQLLDKGGDPQDWKDHMKCKRMLLLRGFSVVEDISQIRIEQKVKIPPIRGMPHLD